MSAQLFDIQNTLQDIVDNGSASGARALKGVLNHLSCGALIVRKPERRIHWANDGIETLLGHRPGELAGKSTEVLHVDDWHYERFLELSNPDTANGKPFRGRFWMRHATGHCVPTEHLVTPVQMIDGDWATVSMMQSLFGKSSTPIDERVGNLTEREREIFDLTIAGQTAKETARILRLSPRTVEVHRDRVLDKLGYCSVIKLMADLVQARGLAA